MFTKRRIAATIGAGALGIAAIMASTQGADAASKSITFAMSRSAGAIKAHCIPNARATVKIVATGPVETMDVYLAGLPANTGFDFFVIQVPDAPFGVSWYQGDIETNSAGSAHGHFVGRFNIETFAVAPGVAPAPFTEHTDATKNPAFKPIQMYHLGIWFNSPADANRAHCGTAVTPFNGEHNAGGQALSTRNFRVLWGPLRSLR